MNDLKYNIGDTVKVLPPFNESFPDSYAITEIVTNNEQPTVFVLGEVGGFDEQYLEKV